MDGDGMVPLAVILRRQMSWERIEKPDVLYEAARESKKGEDFTLVKTECQRVPGHGDTTVSVPAVINLLTHKVHILDSLFCICRI